MGDELETRNLLLSPQDYVQIKCRDDLITIGPIDSCDDQCPVLLAWELEELRAMYRAANRTGRAFAATCRDAELARNNPGGRR